MSGCEIKQQWARRAVRRLGLLFMVALATTLALPDRAHADCQPAIPMDGDTVSCTGMDSTGYVLPSGLLNVAINVEDMAVIDDSNPLIDAALDLSDSGASVVVIGTINVTEAGGSGIFGTDPTNLIAINPTGVLNVNADSAFGINLPNGSSLGVVNRGLIDVTGDDSIGMLGGDNSVFNNSSIIAVTPSPTIQLTGDRSIGMQIGDNSSATNGGEIFVDGAGAIGMKSVGSGSVLLNEPSTVNSTGIFVTGDTDMMSGMDAIGMQADGGIVQNLTLIDVTGNGAVGVELGSSGSTAAGTIFYNGRLDTLIPSTTPTITGGPNAGPLIRIGVAGTSTEQYVIINRFASEILASPGQTAILGNDGPDVLQNQGTIEGVVALGAGDDVVLNTGTLDGLLQLGDGDDTVRNSGSFQQLVELGAGDDSYEVFQQSPGVVGDATNVDAGSDTDTLRLTATSTFTDFDLTGYTNFETLEIVSGGAWVLTPSAALASFGGTTIVRSGGSLDVDLGLSLGGDYVHEVDGVLYASLTTGGGINLDVSGGVDLSGGILVLVDDGTPTDAETLTVVRSGTALTGTFDQVVLSTQALRRTITESYTANALNVTFQVTGFLALANTPNRRAIATAFDLADAMGPPIDFANVITGLDNSNTRGSFDPFGPEAYDAQTALLLEATRQLNRLLTDRPRDCLGDAPDRWAGPDDRLPCQRRSGTPWLAALGGGLDRDSEPAHLGYDARFGGAAVGYDHPVGDALSFTGVISAQRGAVDVARSDESTVTTFDLTGHASLRLGPVRAQALFGYGHGWHDSHRTISIPGLRRGVDSDHESDRITAVLDLGAEFDLGRWTLEPVASVHWTQLFQEEISESGAVAADLEIDERDDAFVEVTAGFRLSTLYNKTEYWTDFLELADGVWRPELEFRWRQIVVGAERDVKASFAGAPTVGFEVSGDDGEMGGEIGLGLTFTPAQASNLDLTLRYETFVGENLTSQSIVGRVRVEF